MEVVRLYAKGGARGPRILLRPLRLGDASALFEAVEVSRRRITRTVPWSPSIHSVEDMRRRIRTLHTECRRGEGRRYAIVVADTRAVIGSSMLGLGNVRHGTAIVGAWLRVDEWGNGYASEAAILMCHIVFEAMGLERVEFWIGPRNRRSRRVPERMGVPLEGILRNHYRLGGELVNSCIYAAIRSDFRRLAPRWERRLRTDAARSRG